jgi:hypothetical protein
MSPIRRKIQRLLALFIFGCIVLNYPLLALFSKNVLWFGIPSLFLYLFIIWAVFIIFIALVTERKKMPKTSFPLTYKKEG